jgi:TP901 family phage tail tape measure protein
MLGAVRVAVLPDLAGFTPAVRRGVAGANLGAEGKKAGKAYGSGLSGALKSLKGTLAVAGIAGLAIGIDKSVKAASEFQSQMEKIHTQAGGTQRDVTSLSKAILGMTNAQQGPQQLAQAMFHLKSVGLDNVNAMKALKAASDLAAVGGADLEDTTNAVAGAWRSGVKGAQTFGQAAATVNSIVGAGNVKMGDLVNAIGTGILPSARAFGVSFKSVGAALALMTDEGIPAQQAATRLRMSLSLLGAPSNAAEQQLKSIGLTGLKLANDLRSPGGIVAAIGDLKSHLEASGKSASAQAQILSHAFGGGRSSSAILTLINNYGVLQRKQDQVNAGISKFGEDVAAQKQTAEAQFHILGANVERLGISIGNVLLPAAAGFTKFLNTFLVPGLGHLASALTGSGKGSTILRDSLFGVAAAFAALKSIGLVTRLISSSAASFGRLALVFRSMKDAAAAGTGIKTLASGVGTLAARQGTAVAGAGALGAAIGGISLSAAGATLGLGAVAAGVGYYIYTQRNSLTLSQQINRQFDTERAKLGFNAAAYDKLAGSIGKQARAQEQVSQGGGRLDAVVQNNTARITTYATQQNKAVTAGKNLSDALNSIQIRMNTSRGDAINLAQAAGVSAKQLAAGGEAGRKAAAKVAAYGQANEAAVQPVKGLNTDLQVTSNKALSATDRINGLTSALGKLLDPLTSNSDNLVTFYNDLKTATGNLRASGGAMGYLTQKQRDSRGSFNAVLGDLESLITNTHQSSTQLDANRKMVEKEIPRLYDLAGSNKSARAEVAALAKAVRGQTGDIGAGHGNRADLTKQTGQAGQTASTAKGDITRLATAIRHIPSFEGFKLQMTGSGAYTIHGPGANFIGPATGRGGVGSRPRAGGGPVTGPGGPRDDRAGLFALSNKEWVIQARSASKYGSTAMSAVNAGTAQIVVPGLAAGGLVEAGSQAVLSGQYAVNMTGTFRKDLTHSMASAMREAIKKDKAAAAAAFGAGEQGDTGARTRSAAVAQAYAASQLGRFGWGPGQMGPLIMLWNQESGWSAYAVNQSSGAAGIAQSLGHGPVTLGDYVGQINWGLGYIKSTYLSPAGAWAHEQAFNWYGNGLRDGVFDRPTLIGVGERGRERVNIEPLSRPQSPATGGSAAGARQPQTIVGAQFTGPVYLQDKTQALLLGQQTSWAISKRNWG